MIETTDTIIAENPEEAYWVNVKKQAEKSIESMQHEILINQAIIRLAEEKQMR